MGRRKELIEPMFEDGFGPNRIVWLTGKDATWEEHVRAADEDVQDAIHAVRPNGPEKLSAAWHQPLAAKVDLRTKRAREVGVERKVEAKKLRMVEVASVAVPKKPNEPLMEAKAKAAPGPAIPLAACSALEG